MIVIGLGYKKRVGKDTVGNHLVAEHGFRKLFFAEALKNACADIFGFNQEQLHGSLKDEVDPFWGFTPGWAMQRVGTEGVRNTVSQDVWVRSVEQKLARTPPFVPGIVITDVRFPNEVAMVKNHKGLVFRLDRPWVEATRVEGRSGAHASEVALDNFSGWDGVIENKGTILDLKHKVDALLKDIRMNEPKHG